MIVTGVIVEYNPFHNGHDYHLQQAKAMTNSDITIAIMSGHFLQRGEPAIVSKWHRTEMALRNGIDLVIELPYAYATQKAETFAKGAISLLKHLGAHYVVFGSEAGTIEPFQKLIAIEQAQQSTYNDEIKKYMQLGYSYPKALALSYESLSSDLPIDVHQPNNILGLHYVKAIHHFHSSIKGMTIQRIASHYHDESLNETKIASATSIRKTLAENNYDFSSVSRVLPFETLSLLQDYWQKNGVLHTWENYFPLLRHKILTMPLSQLQLIYEIEEGIEYRLKKYMLTSNTFYEFMQQIKTKRYTWTRLQRMCLHILTNATKEQFASIPEDESVPYIRLLGMNKKGQQYIRQIKKELPVPLLSTNKGNDHPLSILDQQATFTYAYPIQSNKQNEYIRHDLFHVPIIKENYQQ
ncbi:MAG: nucleotidyltransferase [Bacillaceae bacterium]